MKAACIPSLTALLLLLATPAEAQAPAPGASWAAPAALVVFLAAVLAMLAGRAFELRRCKPTLIAAGVIWSFVALAYGLHDDTAMAAQSARDALLDVTEPFLFLLVMMAYGNAMEERGLFAALREQLLMTSVSLRAQYWLVGITAFSIAPLIGDVATALLMTGMVLAMGGSDRRFVGVSCINVVVASNAGGVCSPFGDITSLLVWQRGAVELGPLLELSIPAFVAWLVPALIMSRSLPDSIAALAPTPVVLERGAMLVLSAYAVTITLAVAAQAWLHLPAVLGMMTGLGLLALCGYHLRRVESSRTGADDVDLAATALDLDRVLREDARARRAPFDVFAEIRRVDWDTLLYLYGAVLCIAGLAALGYAARGAAPVYGGVEPLTAYARLGLLSAVDSLLVMLGVLAIPAPAGGDAWLWQTLTIGLGGSLLAVGSPAGLVALRQARGAYGFATHLRWSWAIALGYAAGIGCYWLMS